MIEPLPAVYLVQRPNFAALRLTCLFALQIQSGTRWKSSPCVSSSSSSSSSYSSCPFSVGSDPSTASIRLNGRIFVKWPRWISFKRMIAHLYCCSGFYSVEVKAIRGGVPGNEEEEEMCKPVQEVCDKCEQKRWVLILFLGGKHKRHTSLLFYCFDEVICI